MMCLWVPGRRWGKLVLISAHALHVGWQQKSRWQKDFLLVHHFGQTRAVVEGAFNENKEQSGHSRDWMNQAGCVSANRVEQGRRHQRFLLKTDLKLLIATLSRNVPHASFLLTCRDEVHVLTHGVQQQPLEAGSQRTTGRYEGTPRSRCRKTQCL